MVVEKPDSKGGWSALPPHLASPVHQSSRLAQSPPHCPPHLPTPAAHLTAPPPSLPPHGRLAVAQYRCCLHQQPLLRPASWHAIAACCPSWLSCHVLPAVWPEAAARRPAATPGALAPLPSLLQPPPLSAAPAPPTAAPAAAAPAAAAPPPAQPRWQQQRRPAGAPPPALAVMLGSAAGRQPPAAALHLPRYSLWQPHALLPQQMPAQQQAAPPLGAAPRPLLSLAAQPPAAGAAAGAPSRVPPAAAAAAPLPLTQSACAVGREACRHLSRSRAAVMCRQSWRAGLLPALNRAACAAAIAAARPNLSPDRAACLSSGRLASPAPLCSACAAPSACRSRASRSAASPRSSASRSAQSAQEDRQGAAPLSGKQACHAAVPCSRPQREHTSMAAGGPATTTPQAMLPPCRDSTSPAHQLPRPAGERWRQPAPLAARPRALLPPRAPLHFPCRSAKESRERVQ